MEAEIKWLDDPETFRVNQLPALVTTTFTAIMRNGNATRVVLNRALMVSGNLSLPKRLRKGLRIFTRSILTLVTLIKLKFQVKLS